VRGDWRFQHDARPLSGGRVLFFDNLGQRDHSRVLEVDARDGAVLWRYQASEPGAFLSLCCGASQRLANGNTLITETARGHAFEVDPAGDTVWEYWSPHRVVASDGSEKVARLFEVLRLPDAWPAALGFTP
jgi:outer membrane protein assembly factor BamB